MSSNFFFFRIQEQTLIIINKFLSLATMFFQLFFCSKAGFQRVGTTFQTSLLLYTISSFAFLGFCYHISKIPELFINVVRFSSINLPTELPLAWQKPWLWIDSKTRRCCCKTLRNTWLKYPHVAGFCSVGHKRFFMLTYLVNGWYTCLPFCGTYSLFLASPPFLPLRCLSWQAVRKVSYHITIYNFFHVYESTASGYCWWLPN